MTSEVKGESVTFQPKLLSQCRVGGIVVCFTGCLVAVSKETFSAEPEGNCPIDAI